MQTCPTFNYVEFAVLLLKGYNKSDEEELDDILNFSRTQPIYETIRAIAPSEEMTISNVFWASNKRKIEFEPIFTEEGLCFTFNSINSHEMFTDEYVCAMKIRSFIFMIK